jgi:hypothetical protein
MPNCYIVPEKSVYWAKLFLGTLFTEVKCIFLKSVKKQIFFLIPHSTNSKQKVFVSEKDNEL